MPGAPETVTVVAAGHALQGWQSVAITRAAEAAAISFSLVATNPAWTAEARAIRRGGLVQIYATPGESLGAFAGGDLACTGYADDYEVDSSATDRSVGLSGRSKAGDAIDCPPVRHQTGLEENKTLVEAANAFDEWGIGFRADVEMPKLPEVQLVPGEPLFNTLEREARHLGVLMMGEPDGGVLLTRAGKKRHAGAIVHGQTPAKKWKLNLSIAHKRSEIHTRGQRSLGTDDAALRQNEVAQDGSVGRHRPYILWNEGDQTSEELARRGEWERLRRSGSGISISVHVWGWRDEAGRMWTPGHVVPVVWDEEEVDQDLAIKSVTFRQTVAEGEGGGTWAELTLVDPRTLGGKDAGSGGGGAGAGSGAGDGGGRPSVDFGGGLDGAAIESTGGRAGGFGGSLAGGLD